MTDTVRLVTRIRQEGTTYTHLSKKMGITNASLGNKINNVTEFKASEIVALGDLLHMTAEERDEIFLAKSFH